jgi:hypothetical protein
MAESTDLVDPRASVRAYLEAEKADGTRRAYKSDWDNFCAWCDRAGEIAPATPIAVATYLVQLANGGRKALELISSRPRREWRGFCLWGRHQIAKPGIEMQLSRELIWFAGNRFTDPLRGRTA